MGLEFVSRGSIRFLCRGRHLIMGHNALVKGQQYHVAFSLTFYKIDIYALGLFARHFTHFLL